MNWLVKSWSYLVSWGGFLGAAIVAIRAVYAAERDRRALNNSELEREKLSLEVARLRNSPEVVADRRVIYDKLREVLFAIVQTGTVELDQIKSLHAIRHDSEFRFPPPIVESVRGLINFAVEMHISWQTLQRGAHQVSNEVWQTTVNKNSIALLGIVEFQQGMADRFRPFLSL